MAGVHSPNHKTIRQQTFINFLKTIIMNKLQHVSKGIPQATMLGTTKVMNQSFITDNQKFIDFDPGLNLDYSAKITLTIETIENLPPDYVLVAHQMEQSSKIIKFTERSLIIIRAVKYYVETAFPDEGFRLYEFGFPGLKKVINSQSKFIIFLKSFNITLLKFKTELTAVGLSTALIDEIVQIAKDLDKANVDHEVAKNARIVATGMRIKAFDEMWKLIGKVAKVGKIIYESDPDNQRKYVLDSSPKKKTIKIDDAEVNTSFLQGKVTDSETHEELEDVNIEIVGTDYKAITDEDGEFYIDGITPATYSVKITAVGYKELLKTDIKLDSDNLEQEFEFVLEAIIV